MERLGRRFSALSSWNDAEERTHRLLSAEFIVYYVLLAVTYWRWTVHFVEISNGASDKLRGLQWNSWLGRKTDMSDYQSSMYRAQFGLLFAAMAAFVVVRWLLLWVWARPRTRSGGGRSPASPNPKPSITSPQTQVRLLSGLFLAGVSMWLLHGTAVVFIMVIVTVNYGLALWVGRFAASRARKDSDKGVLDQDQPVRQNWQDILRRFAPLVTWVFNIVILVANDYFRGYRWSSIHPVLSRLDMHRGMYQWHVGFNMIMLHMISFNMDYFWFATRRESTVNWDKHQRSCDACQGTSVMSCYMRRQEMHLHQPGAYSYVMYLAYIFYIPLYLAGPIITFNAFASQTISPSKASVSGCVKYGLRFIGIYVLFEVMCAYMYVLAINKSPWVWKTFTPSEIGVLGYFTILFLWLKFNVIWKLARWFAMLDGMETIENMPRCVNNHYAIAGFWRSWHRSFNRWIIRYIYVPLGGARNRFLAIGVTFTFVAVWHDITLKLLVWGWGVTILFGPEMIAQHACRILKWKPGRKVTASFAAINIFWLIVANVLGFSVGVDGMKQMLSMIFEDSQSGAIFIVLCWFCLYMAASTVELGPFAAVFIPLSPQIMLEIRKLERASAAARQKLYASNAK